MDLLKRLKQLAKTGKERFVILDENGEDGFVLVPLNEYQTNPEPECSPMPEPEHKLVPPPIQDEIKISVKVGKPDQSSKMSQKFEDEEKFYLEPLR